MIAIFEFEQIPPVVCVCENSLTNEYKLGKLMPQSSTSDRRDDETPEEYDLRVAREQAQGTRTPKFFTEPYVDLVIYKEEDEIMNLIDTFRRRLSTDRMCSLYIPVNPISFCWLEDFLGLQIENEPKPEYQYSFSRTSVLHDEGTEVFKVVQHAYPNFRFVRLVYNVIRDSVWLRSISADLFDTFDCMSEASTLVTADFQEDFCEFPLISHYQAPRESIYPRLQMLMPQSGISAGDLTSGKRNASKICHEARRNTHNERSTTPPPYKAFGRIITPPSASPDKKKKQKDLEKQKKRDYKLGRLYPHGLFTTSVELPSDIKVLMQDFNANVSGFVNQIPKIEESFNKGITVKHDAGTFIKMLPPVCAIAFTGFLAYRTRERKWLSAFIVASGAVAIGGAFVIGKTYIDIVQRFTSLLEAQCHPVSLLKPQAMSSGDASLLMKACTALLFTDRLGAPIPKSAWNFLSDLTFFDKLSSNMQGAFTFAVTVIERCINFFRDHVLGLGPIKLINDVVPELRNWCAKVDCLVEESHAGRLAINKVNAERVFALQQEGRHLTKTKLSMVDNAAFRACMNTYSQVLTKMATPFEQANIVGGGPRMEPYCILFSGISGVGKSWAALPVLKALIEAVIPKEMQPEFKANFMDFVYNRQAEHKYWDGYRSQFAVWVDDFGQVRDVAGNPDNEFMEMIRMINITPNILHMADLASKGNNVFNSKIVLATSNTMVFNPQSITEAEALMRRFDVVIRVCPLQEWSVNEEPNEETRRLDVPKVLKHLGDGFHTEVYMFRMEQIDPSGQSSPIKGWVKNFDQLVEWLTIEFKKKEAKNTAYLNMFYPQAGEEEETQKVQIEMEEMESLPDISDFDMEDLLNDEINKPLMDNDAIIEWKLNNLDHFEYIRVCVPPHAYLSKLDHAYYIRKVAPKAFDQALRARRLPEIVSLIIQHDQYQQVLDIEAPPKWRATDHMIRSLKRARKTVDGFCYIIKQKIMDFDREHPWVKWVLGFIPISIGMFKMYKAFFGSKFQRNIPYWCPPDCYASDHEFLGCNICTPPGGWNSDFDIGYDMSLFPTNWRNLKQNPAEWRSNGLVPDQDINDWHWCIDEEGNPIRTNDMQPESGKSRPQKKPPKRIRITGLKPQSTDVNNDEICSKIGRRSQYELTLQSGQRIGYVLFVMGKLCIFPKHYRYILQEKIAEGDLHADSALVLRSPMISKGLEISMKDILSAKVPDFWEDQDMCIAEIPNAMQHPDIRKFFITRNQLDKPIDYTLRMTTCNNDLSQENFGTFIKGRPEEGLRVMEGMEGEYRVNLAISYDVATRPGDCGTLLSLMNVHMGPGKICAMHVAGDRVHGVATIISKEDVDNACDFWGEQFPIATEASLMPQCFVHPFDGNFFPLAKVEPLGRPIKTKIVQSKLFGVLGPSTTAPARLARWNDHGVIRDPMIEAISRYGKKRTIVDIDLFKQAADSYLSIIMNNDHRKRQPRIMTFEEACEGIPEVEFCNAIPRDTSAGYPYVANPKPGFRGKQWYFGKEEKYDFSTPQALELRREVEDIITKAKRGERSLHVYVDTLKDETVSLKKRNNGKTRLVSAAPLALTIVLRMYTLDFCMYMMEGNINLGSGVGVNAYSDTWDVLARRLKFKGANNVAGDYQGFDCSGIPEKYLLALYIINTWYGGNAEWDTIRETLWQDIVNSVHICDSLIYVWLSSLPSGISLTTILNGIDNQINIRSAWIKLMPRGFTIADFDRCVYLIVYGDDNLMSISNEVIGWFNQTTITDALLGIGYIYTDEDKTGAIHISRPIANVSFLKRGFRFEPILGRYVAPLSKDSIREMLYWTKSGVSSDNITRTNVDNALRELSLHGEEHFLSEAPKIVAASRAYLDYQPPIIDFKAWLKLASNYVEFY